MIGELIKSTNTRIAYAEFIKRDGTVRRIWFTTRWRKEYLKDGQLPYTPERHGITIVRDIHLPEEDCLRAIRWDSVIHLTAHGITIEWDEDDETYIYATAEQQLAG
jgi:hypothetical protein